MFDLLRAKPRRCVRIGVSHVVWAEHFKTWSGRHRYRSVVSPTPVGAIKCSPLDLNLVEPAALKECLRTLAGPAAPVRFAGGVKGSEWPRAVTLLLPDHAVRMTVLALDHLPSKREEAEALIRWRLGQEQRMPLNGMKLVWQVFSSSHVGGGSTIVLIVAVQEAIVDQYEALCESAGLIPQEVGVTSLYLFNLWLMSTGRSRQFKLDMMWMTVLDGAMTCVVFHQGRPVFVRTKVLSLDAQSSVDDGIQAEEKIVREASLSRSACEEIYPDLDIRGLVLMADEESVRLDQLLTEELGVGVSRLGWDHVRALGWERDGGSSSSAALPAVAALV